MIEMVSIEHNALVLAMCN